MPPPKHRPRWRFRAYKKKHGQNRPRLCVWSQVGSLFIHNKTGRPRKFSSARAPPGPTCPDFSVLKAMGLLILPLFVGVPIRVARELKTKLPVRLSGLLDAQKCLSYSRFFFGNHFFFLYNRHSQRKWAEPGRLVGSAEKLPHQGHRGPRFASRPLEILSAAARGRGAHGWRARCSGSEVWMISLSAGTQGAAGLGCKSPVVHFDNVNG